MPIDEIVVQSPPFNHHKRRNDRPENESPSSKRSRYSSSPSNNDVLILPDYPMPSQMNLFGAMSNNPSWEITRINREARNQADIANAISKAYFISQNNRPKSTKIAYNSKQNLWKK